MADANSDLRGQVVDGSDLILFDEVVTCLAAGADRAAFIMTWIAAAEGLLSKLRQMADLDGELGSWVKAFEKTQEVGAAKDADLVLKAESIGFLTKAEAISLSGMREHRNLYGHPTASSPRHTEAVAALDTVVSAVLAKPPFIRHGGARALAKRVVEDPHFLPSAATVESFTERTDLIDMAARPAFITELLKGADGHLAAMNHQDRTDRCSEVAASALRRWAPDLSASEWKIDDLQQSMPAATSDMVARPGVWELLSSDDQDRIMSHCLDPASGRQFLWEPARLLARADGLAAIGLLRDEHERQLDEVLRRADPRTLHASGVRFRHAARRICDLLDSGSYRKINDGVDVLRTVDRDELAGLELALQRELGLRLGYGANSGGFTAQNEIGDIPDCLDRWPLELLRGVVAGGLAGEYRPLANEATARRAALVALTDPTGDLAQAALDHLGEDHSQFMASRDTVASVREILDAAPSNLAKDKLIDFLDRVAAVPTAT